MAEVNKLLKAKAEAEAKVKEIEQQILQQSLDEFKPALDNALELAEAMVDHDPSNRKVKDAYKECRSLVRKIVASVFGEEYKISKTESAKRSGSSSGDDFSWEEVSAKMKSAGITAKTKAVGKSDLEKIVFGKGGMKKFRASRWNNVGERAKILEKIGDNNRDTKYYLKK